MEIKPEFKELLKLFAEHELDIADTHNFSRRLIFFR